MTYHTDKRVQAAERAIHKILFPTFDATVESLVVAWPGTIPLAEAAVAAADEVKLETVSQLPAPPTWGSEIVSELRGIRQVLETKGSPADPENWISIDEHLMEVNRLQSKIDDLEEARAQLREELDAATETLKFVRDLNARAMGKIEELKSRPASGAVRRPSSEDIATLLGQIGEVTANLWNADDWTPGDCKADKYRKTFVPHKHLCWVHGDPSYKEAAEKTEQIVYAWFEENL